MVTPHYPVSCSAARSVRCHVRFPELSIAVPGCLNERESLGNQLIRGETVERESTFLGIVEVSVVGCVAEHASGDDVVQVVSIQVALGEQMIPGEREPATKSLSSV